MTMHIRVSALFALCIMASTASANALYIRADFAYSWLWDQSATADLAAGDSRVNVTPESVPLGQLGVGYLWSPYVRFDVTGSLFGRRNTPYRCDGASSLCTPGTKGSATIDTSTLFANAYYELSSLWTQEETRWHPYIGIGLGSAYHYVHAIESILPSSDTVLDVSSHGQWQFAWRGIAGLAVTLADNLLMDIAYVYMDAGDATTGDQVGFNTSSTAMMLQKTPKIDMKSQEVYIGLRHQF